MIEFLRSLFRLSNFFVLLLFILLYFYLSQWFSFLCVFLFIYLFLAGYKVFTSQKCGNTGEHTEVGDSAVLMGKGLFINNDLGVGKYLTDLPRINPSISLYQPTFAIMQ